MRSLLALTLLLTCTGLSAEDFPFEMKGFYPSMPEAEFDALAESYGAIGSYKGDSDSMFSPGKYHFFSECVVTMAEYRNEGVKKEGIQKTYCYKSEMSKFTLGGQPVYSVSQKHYQTTFRWVLTFALHTENQPKYLQHLKELLTKKYGEPEPNGDYLQWKFISGRYIDELWLSNTGQRISGEVKWIRDDEMAREEHRKAEVESNLEDL